MKREDYWAFLRLMFEAQIQLGMSILAYCLMPNHFHLIVRPESDVAISEYMHWLLTTHVRRYHGHYGTTGTGHVYQGRYKNFLVQPGAHLLRVLRYVEANAVRASLVLRAEDWTWSSLQSTGGDSRPILSPSPIARPPDWLDYVNEAVSLDELFEMRRSVIRDAPYGDAEWTAAVAREHHLESTLRGPGRPKSNAATIAV